MKPVMPFLIIGLVFSIIIKPAQAEVSVSALHAERPNGISARRKIQTLQAELKKRNSQLINQIKKLNQQNRQLQEANNRLSAAKRILGAGEAKLKAVNKQQRERLDSIGSEKLNNQEMETRGRKLDNKIKELSKKIEGLNSQVVILTQEKLSLYEETANALMQAGISDKAITMFEKLLKINPEDADAHYKLGFLYKRSRDNNHKAVSHFKEYLWLKPDAKNRKDVEYMIRMLSQYDWDDLRGILGN